MIKSIRFLQGTSLKIIGFMTLAFYAFSIFLGVSVADISFGPPPSSPPCQGSTKGCVNTATWWQTSDTTPSTFSALQSYLNSQYVTGGGSFGICKTESLQNYIQNQWSGSQSDVLAQLIATLLNENNAVSGTACMEGPPITAKSTLLTDLLCASGYISGTQCNSPLTRNGCGNTGTDWSDYASALDNSVTATGLAGTLATFNAGSDDDCNYGPCSCPSLQSSPNTCCNQVHKRSTR